MVKKLRVNKHKCSCCRLCADEYPETFRIEKENYAVVYNQNALTEEQLHDVISLCPTKCISYD